MQGGVGFPTGVSIDNVAAHYTPNPGEKKYLNSSNVCSVDIGIHVNGMIVDSAFTIAFDSKFENLLNAPKEATEAGLNAVGIDARLGEIGAVI